MTHTTTFFCQGCRQTVTYTRPEKHSGAVGYGLIKGEKHCFSCIADYQRQVMRDTGRITLYLVEVPGDSWRKQYQLTNWHGELKFRVSSYKKGRHNLATTRLTVWIAGPDGYRWWGVNYGGNTQLCHCTRTKTRIKHVLSPCLSQPAFRPNGREPAINKQ